jgi:Tol biopolymer transport system component
MAHSRTFRLQDLLGYKALSLPTCTSDGRLAAFVATQPDVKSNKSVSELWVWEEGCGAWQVTFGGRAGRPAFSPRGQRLAFLSDRAGEKQQLFVMGRLLSEGRKITDMDEGVTGFGWNPDGRRLAFLAVANRTPEEKNRHEEKRDAWTADRDERRRRLWVVRAEGGQPVPVSAADEHVNAMAWTPDGKRLVYSACPRAVTDSQGYESDLKIVSADGQGRRVVGPHRSHGVEGRMSVSPDGRCVLLTEWHDETDQWHDTAKVVDLATGRRRPVAKDFDLQSVYPQWVGTEVCFEAGEGTSLGLWLCAVGGRPRKLLTGPGAAGQSVAAPGANRIFYIYSEGCRADELHARSLDGRGEPHPSPASTAMSRASGWPRSASSDGGMAHWRSRACSTCQPPLARGSRIR